MQQTYYTTINIAVWNAVSEVKILFHILPNVLIKHFNYNILKASLTPVFFFPATKPVYHNHRIMAIFSTTKAVHLFFQVIWEL